MINLKKLLTENTVAEKPKLMESDHVHNGLQKVFSAGDLEISYRRCENVGLGYIKSVSEAVKVAIQESRKVAKIFGYRDDEQQCKFIKEEDGHLSDFDKGECENDRRPPVSTPGSGHAQEESREVEIGQELKKLASTRTMMSGGGWDTVSSLADELIQMHGVK